MRYIFNFFLLPLALSIAILKWMQRVSPFPQNIVYVASIICNTRVQESIHGQNIENEGFLF